jgi:hypothetical protein
MAASTIVVPTESPRADVFTLSSMIEATPSRSAAAFKAATAPCS